MTAAANTILQETFTTGRAIDSSGQERQIHSSITQPFADAIGRVVSDLKPKLSVEIGLANGPSAVAILAAGDEDSRLISIDPFQDEQWHGIGRKLVERAGFAHRHELIQEFDYLALPRLLGEGTVIDFAYIDGMHTFDYVVLDTFYVDKLLRVGGIVGFNDCGFRSVHKFLKFFMTHRDYEEIDVGLPKDFRGANPLVTVARKLTGRSNSDRYFRKRRSWEPAHGFFKPF